jgi:multidrug efflux system outer membrane protein
MTVSSIPRRSALTRLDLFGRVRRHVEAARADVGVAEATRQDARVSVIAEVTRDYFVLRGLQDQLALTRRNGDNQASTLRLTRARLDAGRGNELDTARAEAQWQTIMSTIPTLESMIATTMYRLSVLTGRPPLALTERLEPQPLPALPALNSIGSPELLLRRRPDIRVAERRLAGATARIGVAVGDLFPIRLSGAEPWRSRAGGGQVLFRRSGHIMGRVRSGSGAGADQCVPCRHRRGTG